MRERILVADDEAGIANPIAYALRREEFEVDIAFDGQEALDKINAFKPNIVLLDINMPKVNGFDVIKKIQSRQNMGIIFLTAKNDIVDRVVGLELGADDYITKPFDIREVIARIKSLLRRMSEKTQTKEDILQAQHIRLNQSSREVYSEGQLLDLTPKEYDLLLLFLSNPGRVYTRENLLDIVWGMEYVGGTRTVDIHIQRLRKKLGEETEGVIQTVHGIGYKGVGKT